MKLLFTGDVNFRGMNILSFEDSEKILSDVQPYIDAVDFVIPNLECPLADEKIYKPIKKSGPNLICNPQNITFLKALKTQAVTLANNHIGDFGEGAVKDTLALLKKNNILYTGAGKDINQAYNACRLHKNGKSISILSVCENEFGMATETNYGSAGYNPSLLLKSITIEKVVSDYIVVVFHGGNEFNPLPSPDTVDRYRFICDMGADAVIGGHTHCPQGYEIYNGKPIVYSMGNFLFKSRIERKENDSWYYGYMSILEIKDTISLEIVPYKFNTNATKITVFTGKDKTLLLEYIEKLSRIIKNSEELASCFKGWAWNHQWCPSLKADNYGAWNLTKCEAHHSQLKSLLQIYAEKILKMQKNGQR